MDKTPIEKKIDKLETRLSIAGFVAVLLAFGAFLLAGYLAENVFTYEVIEEKTKRESYQHIIGEVDTYICYTTTYGDHYHASGCGSLWNSKHQTTVYEAERRGYDNCRKCEPYERTTLTLTETRYRDVTYQESITKQPKLELCVIALLLVIILYAPISLTLNRKIAILKKEKSGVS